MGKSKGASAGGLKLNYKRTFLIGFAFFGILLLWQVYDSWCPTFLTDIFARRMFNLSSAELKAGDPAKILEVQWIVGIIMACDNLAALILLPIFGNLSDKTHTPIGKRMPYILTGTFGKALGVGLSGWEMPQAAVTRDAAGAPHFALTGAAAALAEGWELALSLSHDGGYAVAMVVAWRGE